MVSGAANDVSNSHEPSYYEIALTNGQLVDQLAVMIDRLAIPELYKS